ncbi:thiamine pyrophosphate-dependent enzyme [Candidatus Glomeribacter gigasporarum]|uniref:thiamine pyrophosphate-dependent enzyme n=1 Tax=Candidatus Glomeribacter gigasporarum TaxID=132144 RepID=UPI000306435D|nr:thiamine pyrophosphate-dependent enzyme [Candidatus Glomeribacter gigasporarum]
MAILVGARANHKRVSEHLVKLSEKYNVLVASTVSSKGVFPENHRNYLGVYGYSGHRRAIETLLSNKIETLILLGFDTTQWTSLVWEEDIKKGKYLLQVGTDIKDLDFVIDIDSVIISDEAEFLSFLERSGCLEKIKYANESLIKDLQTIPLFYEVVRDKGSGIHPADAIQMINECLGDYICIADSGNHRSFTTHYWVSRGTNKFFSANTICPVGWAIPASVGISLARKDSCVVMTGDGCMLMHGIEIQTAARYKRDILYIVFNNSYYGATYFNNKRNIKEMSALPTHNWKKFSESLGLTGWRVNTLDELRSALKNKSEQSGTFLIDMICDHEPETPVSEYKARVVEAGVL